MSDDRIVFQWPNNLQELHKHVTMFFAEQHFKCDSFSQKSRDFASWIRSWWRKSSLRDLNESNFPCELNIKLNKVDDDHKIISVALLVLTFCGKTSIQNSFFTVLVFDSIEASTEYSSARETAKSCLVGCLAGVEQPVGFEFESDNETFQMGILFELTSS